MLGLDATPISRPNSCNRQRRVACCKQWRRHVGAAAGGTSAGTASGSPFTDLMQAIQAQLQQQAPDSEPPSTEINVQNLCYHPAGTLFLAIKKGPDDRSVDDISTAMIISCSFYLLMEMGTSGIDFSCVSRTSLVLVWIAPCQHRKAARSSKSFALPFRVDTASCLKC